MKGNIEQKPAIANESKLTGKRRQLDVAYSCRTKTSLPPTWIRLLSPEPGGQQKRRTSLLYLVFVLYVSYIFCFSVQNIAHTSATSWRRPSNSMCVFFLKLSLITQDSERSQVPWIATLKSFSIKAKCVVVHLDWIVWCVRYYDSDIKNWLNLVTGEQQVIGLDSVPPFQNLQHWQ